MWVRIPDGKAEVKQMFCMDTASPSFTHTNQQELHKRTHATAFPHWKFHEDRQNLFEDFWSETSTQPTDVVVVVVVIVASFYCDPKRQLFHPPTRPPGPPARWVAVV